MENFLVPVRRVSAFDRPDLISEMKKKLTNEGHAVIWGEGGTGKTQLALDFCHKYKRDRPDALVIWIGAETRPYQEERLREICEKFSLVDQTNVSETMVTWLRLHAPDDWLLVLDDIGETFLPESTKSKDAVSQSSTAIFCTLEGDETTLEDLLSTALISKKAHVHVPHPTLNESLEIFKQHCPETPRDAKTEKQIILSLECSLLACSLAAAYIVHNGITLGDYLVLLQHQDMHISNISSTPISRTLMLSLRQLKNERPQALDISNIMAMLDRQSVLESLLFDARNCPNTRNFYGSLRKLESLSLIQKNNREYYYSMSRLVRDFFVEYLKSEKKLESQQQFVIELLSDRYPHGDRSLWIACRAYNPHAAKALGFQVEVPNEWPRAELMTNVASYHQSRGNFETAQVLYTKLLDIYASITRLSAKQENQVVKLSLKLAQMLGKRSQFDAGERILEETMKRIKLKLRPGNPQLIHARDLQAWFFSWKGQHAESERLWRLCLKDNNDMFYETHVDSLIYQSNITTALIEQEKYVEAEELLAKTIRARISVRGNDHPDTIQSQQILAALYKEQGKYTEAEELGQQILTISNRVQGSEHPDTLTIVSSLSKNLSALGRFTEAEVMQWRLLASRERQFGPDHDLVILSRINLAVTLEKLGKYSVAEEQNRLALEAQKKLFPSDTHPTTLNIENTLGLLLLRQGEYEKAEPVLREVLRKRQLTLYAGHGDILTTQNNLAGGLMKQKKYRESTALFSDTLKVAKEKYGEESAFTLRLMNNLSEAMRQGNLEVVGTEQQSVFLEALELQRTSLHGRIKLFGEDHPDVFTSQYNMAHLLHDMDRCSEARKLYAKAAGGLRLKLGEAHPMTIECETNFAICTQGLD